MKAYLTTIGEATTEISKQQLEKFSFEVVVLDGYEMWPQKYKRFIEEANEDCIRIDADVVINSNIVIFMGELGFRDYGNNPLMAQAYCYDFYKNNLGTCGPVYYSKQALEIIRERFDELDLRRPEATAWRLTDINAKTYTSNLVVGIHGFFQRQEDLNRHKQNKIDRKQISQYDFELAEKLIETQNDLRENKL